MPNPHSERISFPGSQGAELAARFDQPVGPTRAVALFAHCFTCSKDIFAAKRIAQELTNHGFQVLRFDFTGLGHSGGEFANTNFSSNVEDLVHAADWLRASHAAPKLLIGHSLGGAAVLVASALIPETEAVVTIGAPADPSHVRHLIAQQADEIERTGKATVTIAERRFVIRKQFLDDIAAQNLESRLGHLQKSLLILHSPADDTVGIDNAGRLFMAAKHPKSFVSLDDADHLLTRPDDAEYAAAVIAAWASRYVGKGPGANLPEAREGEVVVSETGEGRFQNIINAGGHPLFADEPVSMGGADTGPTPYGLLLAALGACTSMTLRLYAARKKLALDHVEVRLSHQKIHAKDCEECETETGMVDRIDRELVIEGDLTDAECQRLLEIADRCPVHRTLHSQVVIASRLSRSS